MPLQATSGAASYDAFGGGVVAEPNYIESVFSTYLYTGNGSTQTITNGIDLSTKGGLVWIKNRGSAELHQWWTTLLGNTSYLRSNGDEALFNSGSAAITYNTTNFSLNTGSSANNANANTYVSWTFRKQPKFFDVVTYTGDGTNNRNVAHSLGAIPGCVIFKRTDSTGDWQVSHRSLGEFYTAILNSAAAAQNYSLTWLGNTATNLNLNTNVNQSGATYVAYLFAHDAGGFGLTGTDNVISCGSFTSAGPSTDVTVTLGYEPQWIMVKDATVSADWGMYDVMRGMSNTNTAELLANKSNAETNTTIAYFPRPTATGFIAKNSLGADSGNNIIYIAIRRGPMKVPTLGTSVFDVDTLTPAANLTGTKVTNPFATDLLITTQRDHAGLPNSYAVDRLRGGSVSVATNLTGAEQSWGTPYSWTFDYNDGFLDNFAYPQGSVTTPMIYWSFKRAPGFFDEVCYTGTGSATTVTHNLTVAPEMMIIKNRSSASHWIVYTAALGNTKALEFTTSGPTTSAAFFNNTSPTSSVFTVNSAASVNGSGSSLVAYLFATCAGVSKVGSYTGNGTTQTINCGFTGGARFVLIKRTDSTGDWYVWDSARGIVAGNDPYLLLNSTAAEVTSTDYIDTASTGFEISSTAPAAINANGGSFIFLAIA
jgi:uncharacterized protein YejL (UPF0352 family)